MRFFLLILIGPLREKFRLALWGCQGWFPWSGVRVYSPRGAQLMREVARTGKYEPYVLQIVTNFTKPGTVFVDIGANIGLVSLAVLEKCRDVVVQSYEPSPNSRDYLMRTRAESGHSHRWHIHNVACAERSGRADFYLSTPGLGAFDGLAASSRVDQKISTSVEIVRLDDEWRGWTNRAVSVVKIDVEGAEGRVCAGMEKLVSACRPVVIVEWNLVNLQANNADPIELFRFAERHSFRIYDPETLQCIPSLHWVRLLLARGRDTFLLMPEEMTTPDALI